MQLSTIKKWGIPEIAVKLDRSYNWVSKWLKRYKGLGIEGLFDFYRSGRPPLLQPENESQFVNRIQAGSTEKDIIESFNARYIKEIAKNEFFVDYSLSGIYKLLKRLDFAKIKPRPKHEKNDADLMQQWKENILPVITQNVLSAYSTKNIEFWFQDEMRFGEKTQLSSQWKLIGTSYTQTQQTGYRNQYIYGAVNPETGKHVGMVSNSVSTEIMNSHLEHISQALEDNSHAILIMDQAGWHSKSRSLITPKNITIVDLPPYSPELNPVERLWGWLKGRYLNNRFIGKNENLTDIGCEVWNQLSENNVKSLCKVSFTNFL